MKKTKVKSSSPSEAVETADEDRTVASDDQADALDATGSRAVESSEAESEAARESADDVTAKSDPLQVLQARVEKLEDTLLRAKADYQNFRRRSAIERANAIRYANAELMKSLLGVIDDFERSLASTEASDNHQAVVDGVRLVYQNLIQALRVQGLETIDALHEPFDPTIHQAMSQQPAADFPPGTVVEVVAKGYRLHDRVLRPAKVIVTKSPDEVKP